MVAIDVDGTLLRSDKALTKRSAQAIMDASKAGVHVVLASARPPRSMKKIYDYLGLKTYQINYNGALVEDPIKGMHIYHKALPMELARRVLAVARRAVPNIISCVEILDKWCTDGKQEQWPKRTMLQFDPGCYGEVDLFLNAPVTKLMFLGETADIMAARKAVLKNFPKIIAVAVSDKHLIQVINPEVEKADGLSLIAAQYGVQRRRCMAIGDAPNDSGMMQWAGLGVAVQNAWPQVLEIADAVVPSNDQDGVAVAIQRYVLSRRK